MAVWQVIKSQVIRFSMILIGLPLFAGCQIIDVDIDFQPDPDMYNTIVTQSEDRFADIDPLYISDEVKNYFEAVVSSANSNQSRVEMLHEILFGEEHLNLQYSDERTLTAMNVFELGQGNCLSVMNLYIAVARHLGLDANFQTVQVRPSWDRRGTLLVLSQHINATGRIGSQNRYVVDFTPQIALQQLTSNIVSDSHARALYFNNLGVEHLVAGEIEQALVYLQNALWIDKDISIVWNNIGTVYNRMDQDELAEYSYQLAFHLDDTNATAINNLSRYYAIRGDDERASSYRRAITQFNQKNPYFHYSQGNLAYEVGDFEQAIRHYRRAIRIKDVEPDFYYSLSLAYARVGDARQQQRMQTYANELAVAGSDILLPSNQKVRFIQGNSILNGATRGLSVRVN